MLISLTQFVDVVARSGFSKYGKVQEVRQQISEDYSPGKDPYKSLREGIISKKGVRDNFSDGKAKMGSGTFISSD